MDFKGFRSVGKLSARTLECAQLYYDRATYSRDIAKKIHWDNFVHPYIAHCACFCHNSGNTYWIPKFLGALENTLRHLSTTLNCVTIGQPVLEISRENALGKFCSPIHSPLRVFCHNFGTKRSISKVLSALESYLRDFSNTLNCVTIGQPVFEISRKHPLRKFSSHTCKYRAYFCHNFGTKCWFSKLLVALESCLRDLSNALKFATIGQPVLKNIRVYV